jgi:hypothetical protein
MNRLRAHLEHFTTKPVALLLFNSNALNFKVLVRITQALVLNLVFVHNVIGLDSPSPKYCLFEICFFLMMITLIR